MNNDEQLRYPRGKFQPKESYTSEEIAQNIERIGSLPAKVEQLVSGFSAKQFETPYREGGWTGRQVVHHLADSHMNAYVRFKWTLTEATPVIKAYDEKLWAQTPEVSLDPAISINLLTVLHQKWVAMLRLLKAEDLKKEFIHPETKKHMSLERMTSLYAWHGEHHLAHLQIIGKR